MLSKCTNLYFPVCSLAVTILLLILFFSKKNVGNKETHLYSKLIIVGFVEAFTYSFICLIAHFVDVDSNLMLYEILNKFIYCIYILWFSLLYNYEVNISFNDQKKETATRFMYALYCIEAIIMIAIILLPVKIYFDASTGLSNSYGMSANALFIGIGLYVFSIFCVAIINIKKINAKKYTPMFVLMLFMLVALIIRIVDPLFNIYSNILSLVTLVMFFTIENPDLKMAQQLEIAKDAADRANNSKTEFLSSMSHEIRTPLNAIVGFSDCIMDATSVEEAKENAKDIVSASQTLLEIVNGILDISKIEAGKMEIVNVKYNPTEVFTELATLITPRMKEKGLDFTYFIDPNLPATLFGDKANMKKIVTNFLSNACKYTDHGFVRYEVHCVKLGDYCRLVISVEDSGRGIKRDSVDKLFTRFQRLDEDRNTTIEGTGLGLAITKQLTELMGGKVIVHTVYGEGSKFTAVINQKIDSLVSMETPKQFTHLDLNGVRILVVDDAELNLKVTDKLFKKYGANHVDLCSNGFECIEKIQNGDEYDLIFLDDMMPRMNGIETFRKLKENPDFHIPTIALTANAITGMREKYLAEGFDDYLAKPIEQNELIRVCNELLGRNTGFTAKIEIPREEVNIKNSDIIPVEANIEEIIGDSSNMERKIDNEVLLQETIEKKDEEVTTPKVTSVVSSTPEESTINLIPVVDIRFGNTNPPKEEPVKEEQLEEVIVNEDTEELLEDDPTDVVESTDSSEEVYDRSYLEKNGADINHALELLGDMEMYNATIQDFLSEVEDKWKRLEDYRDSGDMKNYAIDVHSLKSDCKYLGFMTLADIAYQHELKSKDNDLEYVKEHFSELEAEYKKTLDIAKNYSSHNPAE